MESLRVMLGTLVICLVAAWLFGRALGIVGDLRTLIGVGTDICGASAIAAVTPVIGAVGVDVAYAVSTIFLFNITAVIVFPMIGHALGVSRQAFGLFAGTAVNDTSSVVAAATTFGAVAANHAVVVKLVRTLMIIPICLGLAWLVSRTGEPGSGPAGRRAPLGRRTGAVSVFLITVALSAIGLSTDLAAFRAAGPRPLLLGGALWVTVSVSSLGLQWASGLL